MESPVGCLITSQNTLIYQNAAARLKQESISSAMGCASWPFSQHSSTVLHVFSMYPKHFLSSGLRGRTPSLIALTTRISGRISPAWSCRVIVQTGRNHVPNTNHRFWFTSVGRDGRSPTLMRLIVVPSSLSPPGKTPVSLIVTGGYAER